MSFIDLIKKRRSIRKFSDTKIDRVLIEKCLEAARLSPSACNAQPWKFIVVDNPELKEKVAHESYGLFDSFNKFTHQAPVMVVVVTEKANLTSQMGTLIKKIQYPFIDIGIASEHFCLQAAELGLGTCMIGWFNEKPLKEILSIPKSKKVVLMIALGYPAVEKEVDKKRKSLDEMSSFDSY